MLTDLPYGNMNTDGGRKLGINGWDFAIEPNKIHEIANRILRKNGKMVLFSQEPYTTELITQSIPNIPFSYRAIWEKDNFANALGVTKNMVGFYEDILIFNKREDTLINPIKEYTNKIREFINKSNKEIFADFEKNGFRKYALLDTFNSDNARRYNFFTNETYDNLEYLYGISKMEGYEEYSIIKNKYKEFEGQYSPTFNLWEGKKYKSNILKYKKDYNGFHPTQKPVLLLEDLIKTFSNENDLVVDLTMGSGSTGVACVSTNRKFIGIELDNDYFNIAKERMSI
ncbi:MAG TPA: site-specific DNA-methyltransferase [Tissierellaceae bacterium]|nr:site-specific DNA-methyltransferase [Tissierellaceae bacterium]